MTTTKPKKRVWEHKTKNTILKPIRWPFKMLEDSQECADYIGENWSDFVRNTVKEKIEIIKAEIEEKNNKPNDK